MGAEAERSCRPRRTRTRYRYRHTPLDIVPPPHHGQPHRSFRQKRQDNVLSFSNFFHCQTVQSLVPRPGAPELNITLLTTGHWPLPPPFPGRLPELAMPAQKAFEEFFARRFTNRKLAWHFGLASTHATAAIPPASKFG